MGVPWTDQEKQVLEASSVHIELFGLFCLIGRATVGTMNGSYFNAAPTELKAHAQPQLFIPCDNIAEHEMLTSSGGNDVAYCKQKTAREKELECAFGYNKFD